jgi:hypothetical protein
LSKYGATSVVKKCPSKQLRKFAQSGHRGDLIDIGLHFSKQSKASTLPMSKSEIQSRQAIPVFGVASFAKEHLGTTYVCVK